MHPPRIAHSSWNQLLKRLGSRGGWTTGVIVLSSAALGGIAVALWNRKALATFRELEVGVSELTAVSKAELTAEQEDEFF